MDQLRNKLYDYTVQPPGQVWSAVESALDQEMPGLSSRLTNFTATPPFDTWSAIQSGLAKTQEPKVVPIYKRRPARLIAAAAILAIVFIGVRNAADFGKKDQITSIPSAQPAETPRSGDQDADSQQVEKVPSSEEQPARIAERPSARPKAVATSRTKSKSRYVTMSNDEGQTVRLSKKVAPVFNCATAKIKSISRQCKEDIELLQEKMGSSLISPTSDFAGLVDMLKSLEDQQ